MSLHMSDCSEIANLANKSSTYTLTCSHILLSLLTMWPWLLPVLERWEMVTTSALKSKSDHDVLRFPRGTRRSPLRPATVQKLADVIASIKKNESPALSAQFISLISTPWRTYTFNVPAWASSDSDSHSASNKTNSSCHVHVCSSSHTWPHKKDLKRFPRSSRWLSCFLFNVLISFYFETALLSGLQWVPGV